MTSGRLTPAAAIFTKSSACFGSGTAMRASRRTSGPPGEAISIACISLGTSWGIEHSANTAPKEDQTMETEDDRKVLKPAIQIGEELALLSVEELSKRITIFESEIERHKAAIAEKQKSFQAANSVFKR